MAEVGKLIVVIGHHFMHEKDQEIRYNISPPNFIHNRYSQSYRMCAKSNPHFAVTAGFYINFGLRKYSVSNLL